VFLNSSSKPWRELAACNKISSLEYEALSKDFRLTSIGLFLSVAMVVSIVVGGGAVFVTVVVDFKWAVWMS
jgi:hypothetical protein